MKLLNILMVIPFIFLLVACPPAVTDDDDSGDDDSAGDDDSSVGDDDDDDSAEGIIFMDEVRIFIENDCDDMLDNDHDTYVDCSDEDCKGAPDCEGLGEF